MASFLPQVDKLQSLLKNDFKDQLEMMKMFKTKQVAENYLPLIANAKNLEETSQAHQMALEEAGKYGLTTLAPVFNESYSNKKGVFENREKIAKGQGKIENLYRTYAGSIFKDPFNPDKGLVTGEQYIQSWVKAQGGMESPQVYLNADELENSIKANVTTETISAGIAQEGDQYIIQVKNGRKSQNGADVATGFTSYYYDKGTRQLWHDTNKNKKFDEGDFLGDVTDDKVKEQINKIDQLENTKFNQQMDQARLAENRRGNDLTAWSISEGIKNREAAKMGDYSSAKLMSYATVYTSLGKTNANIAKRNFGEKGYKTDSTWDKLLNWAEFKGDQTAFNTLKMLSQSDISKLNQETDFANSSLVNSVPYLRNLLAGILATYSNKGYEVTNKSLQFSNTELTGIKELYGNIANADKILFAYTNNVPLSQISFVNDGYLPSNYVGLANIKNESGNPVIYEGSDIKPIEQKKTKESWK